MLNIGLDFGTTNSIISYFDQERKALDCFRVTADSNPYIPTAISYNAKGTVIGEAAKSKLGNPEAYARFKLMIGRAFEEKMPGQEKTVSMVAGDYLKLLFEQFQNAGNEIGNIVMTIPEAWYQGKKQSPVLRNLQKLFEDQNMKNIEFQSEPVAAAAYYCHTYQQENEQPYDGNLLIIDYGGGTLDVTLCDSVSEKGIHVVESYGFGEEQSPGGCAGSAFDEAVVQILCEAYEKELDAHQFMIVKNELERKLITHAEECTGILKDYYEYPEGMEEEEIFSLDLLGGKAVCCKHLIGAFEKVNAPVLEKAIAKLRESNHIAEGNLQVVMVGGFSNFYCVDATVRKLLGGRVGAADVRFSDLLNQENKALAIAKGAALIADHVIRVTLKTQSELGVEVYGKTEESVHITKRNLPLIKKDSYPEEYETAFYAPERILLMPEGAPKMKIRLYQSCESGERIFDAEKTIGEILGSDAACTGEHQIGMRIDENQKVVLCLKAEDGKVYEALIENLPEELL